VKLGIVGGGVLGLTVALRRTALGDEVTLFEKSAQAGGLAMSFPVTDEPNPADNAYIENFYHHIFGTDKDIIQMIDEMGLTPMMVWKKAPTSNFRDGKVYPFDGVSGILKYKPMSFIDRFRTGLVGAYLHFLVGSYKQFNGITASKWTQRWFGKPSYETVWGPLLRGKFGDKADTIAMSWLWSRLHDRTFKLGYMKGGFHKFYTRLEEEVRKQGADVHLNSNVTAIKTGSGANAGKVVVVADGQEQVFDKVVATVPTRVFSQLAKDELPASYIEKYSGANAGEHLGAHCLILALTQQLMDQTYWLSINDPGFPFLAAVEHTNLMPKEDYGNQHLLYFGNYLPMDHPLFNKSPEEALAEFEPAIKRINPNFSRAWVTKMWVKKAFYAQPIVTTDYLSKLPPHQTPLNNVLLANMGQVYPQDRGQNYSIRLGEKIVKML
jgi:protoporphyrinogen oxidase